MSWPFPFRVIYEDEHILAADKPAGLMVEPDRNNFPNLLQEVKKYLKATTGQNHPYVQHLHRLDRPVSGVVLFTKNRDILHDLSNQFAQREVEKHYLALTASAPTSWKGTALNWHRKEKRRAVIVPEGTEYAEPVKLEYEVEPYQNTFLWKIQLHTGKFHQIRAQLSALSCPILGDALYGSDQPFQPDAIALHATQLIVKHPITKENITFLAPWQNLQNQR